MAPKNKFTKQQLIDAAFDIASEEGFNNITIRKIADRLGSSIAPIYGNYKDVEELKTEVTKKIVQIRQEMIEAQNSGDTFLDLGVASIMFAKKYPLLFENMVLKSNNIEQCVADTNQYALEQMKLEPTLSQFDNTELEELLLKMQAFQIGLSVLARDKSFEHILTEEKIIEMLKSMGRAVVSDIASHKGRE